MNIRDITLKNIYAYSQGNLRYRLYYNKLLRYLIPDHIREQIHFRISTIMDTECYERGSCVHCGCQVPHLQMADKACEGGCYPDMMSAKEWENSKYNTINNELG